MSRFTLLFLLMATVQDSFAQAQSIARYWVIFCDKGEQSQARLAEGIKLSSQQGWTARAIERRERMGIRPDLLDIPVHSAYRTEIEQFSGLKVRGQSRWLNALSVELDDPSLLAELAALPFVSEIRPVMRYRVAEEPIQDRPYSTQPYRGTSEKLAENQDAAPTFSYGQAAFQVEMLRTDALHREGFRGQGMLIGVFDGGFIGTDVVPQFERLRANNGIVDAWNFYRNNDSVYQSSGHGTAVLSAMAGVLPNGAYTGTAPEARYALYLTEVVEFERIIEEDFWVMGAERADMLGVDLINTSLGYTTFDAEDEAFNHTYADMDGNTTIISRGANWAASRGMLVVVSAGNQGGTSWRYISAPADADSALAVGAVNALGQIAHFSSRGPSFDGRVKPNVAAVGQGTALVGTDGNVVFGNGTSFSSPLVCGSAACLWQAFPDKTNMEVFRAIEQSASRFQNPDDSLGYGIPDFSAAWQLLSAPNITVQDGDMAFFPNPLSGPRATLLLGPSWEEGEAEATVFDVAGRKMAFWDLQLSNSALRYFPLEDLDSWASGLYVLALRQGSREHYVKFFIKGR